MITILIPTLNRSEFIQRLLTYYSSVDFKGYIFIGDSSNDDHARRSQQAIARFQDKLKIIYRYYPSPPYTNNALCLQEMIELTPTPYAVYAGDDDFVIPSTLARCAAFLDNHPDYSAAHGLSVNFYKATGAYGPISRLEYAVGHTLESASAVERWKGYMRHSHSPQYYLHRVETWRRMYQDISTVPINYLGVEVLPCSFSAILGKIKELDGISCLFQINDVKSFGWSTHSMYSLTMEPTWGSAVEGLRRVIASELAQRDHLSESEAQEIFDKEFWRHMMILMEAHYNMRYDPANNFSAFKRRFPAMVKMVQWWRQIKGRKYRRISLELLLNSKHPYHADFMPAYQAVVHGPPANLV